MMIVRFIGSLRRALRSQELEVSHPSVLPLTDVACIFVAVTHFIGVLELDKVCVL